MNTQKIYDFYKTEYRVRFVNALRQNWREQKEWSCIGYPKTLHLFLYLSGMNATYTDKDGKTYEAKSGDLVYAPKGAEYKVRFHSFENDRSYSLGLNFFLWDESGEEAAFSDSLKIFSGESGAVMLVKEAERLSFAPTPIPNKQNAILYNLLSELGQRAEDKKNRNNFKLIERGLIYMTEHLEEDVSVEELAKMCNLSAVYFRKLFKRHTGKTPTQYRIDLRLEKAKHYLKYGELSVRELAETLGYSDAAYFIKQFKEEFSLSPLSYRMKTKL